MGTMIENEVSKKASWTGLSQEKLRNILDYDSETGIFIWLIKPARSIKIGDVAGSLTNKNYVSICIDGKRYGGHQLAWLWVHGYIPAMIDHKNDTPWDNRIDNLREATYSQNNHRKSITNPLGHVGVRFRSGYYQAHIRINGVITRIGKYDTVEEAAEAYKQAAKQHFGDFANGG